MQTTRRDPVPVRRPALRFRTLTLLMLSLSLAALVAAWSWGRLPAGVAEAPAVPDRSDAIARAIEVSVADAQAVWKRRMPGYADAGLVLFTGAAATPCSGGAALPGPFYCPETGTIAADLGFLDTFGDRLDRSRDLGLALVAARLAAEHLQREMGLLDAAALRVVGARRAHRAALTASLALQADCMTGVWAAAAAGRLGPVPDGLYDRIVWSWRNVVADLRRDGVRVLPVFDPMAAAPREERAAAFRQGYEAATLDGCPAPAELTRAG